MYNWQTRQSKTGKLINKNLARSDNNNADQACNMFSFLSAAENCLYCHKHMVYVQIFMSKGKTTKTILKLSVFTFDMPLHEKTDQIG